MVKEGVSIFSLLKYSLKFCINILVAIVSIRAVTDSLFLWVYVT